jgi:predicted adenylyl cyclase CyaB
MSKLVNIEIKAQCRQPEAVRQWLLGQKARFVGTDQQTDVYFNTTDGRLKLRRGDIENNLIYYRRTDAAAAKQSDVVLMPLGDTAITLEHILAEAVGIKVVVEKTREIYFLDNVKFHLDQVTGLGSFVEIEAIDQDGSVGVEKLRHQCQYYMEQLQISPDDLLSHSYSDMLLG